MTRLSVNAVIGIVARHYGCTHALLVGPTRRHPTVLQRQVAMWCVAHHFPLSLPQIGQRFGGRDHTTVLHGVGVVSRLLGEDEAFAIDVGRLIARIHAAELAMLAEVEATVNARVEASLQDAAVAGAIEAHITVDGVLGPAVKAYVEAHQRNERAQFGPDEAAAARALRDALRTPRAVWRDSVPVPA